MGDWLVVPVRLMTGRRLLSRRPRIRLPVRGGGCRLGSAVRCPRWLLSRRRSTLLPRSVLGWELVALVGRVGSVVGLVGVSVLVVLLALSFRVGVLLAQKLVVQLNGRRQLALHLIEHVCTIKG